MIRKNGTTAKVRTMVASLALALLLLLPASAPRLEAAPDISAQFLQTAPDIKINPLFNQDNPVHQGFLYMFQFKKSDLEESLTSLLRSKVRGLGLPNENDFSARVIRVNSLKWHVLGFDGTRVTLPDRMPALVKNEGTGGEVDASTLSYVFDTPTDPMDESMIVCSAEFEWQAFSGQTLLPGWPKTQQAFGKYSFTVVDMEPPHNAGITPQALHAACGGTISGFAETVRRAGLESKYSSRSNPAAITITVIDDNPFGDMQQSKLRHKLSNVDGFIFVETYGEKYRQYDYNNPPKQSVQDPFDLESTIYETRDTTAPNDGRFSWSAPIRISSIPGAAVRSKKIGGSGGPRDNMAYFFSVPLEALEAELEKQSPGLSRMPLHFASMSAFSPLDPDAAASWKARGQKALRITFAACDSSGNWIIPDASVINDAGTWNGLVNTIFSLNPSAVGKIKYNTHKLFTSLYVYDDKRPNPVLVMTNTETNHTDIFTVPNSDTSPDPYSDAEAVWEFDHAGASPTMKKLPAEQREAFMKALRVSEDVRLIFKLMAYDNIGKSFIGKDLSLCHGISTPVVTGAQNSRDSMRYATWKITDPSCANAALMTEDAGGQKLFVFPEYIFRSPDPSKRQAVEFEVADTSPFASPMPGPNDAPDFSAGAGQGKFNSRRLRLVFDVAPKSVSVTNMGGETVTPAATTEKK